MQANRFAIIAGCSAPGIVRSAYGESSSPLKKVRRGAMAGMRLRRNSMKFNGRVSTMESKAPRRDVENHRQPNVENRDEYRRPHLPPDAWGAYREGFRRGYNRAMSHLMGKAVRDSNPLLRHPHRSGTRIRRSSMKFSNVDSTTASMARATTLRTTGSRM